MEGRCALGLTSKQGSEDGTNKWIADGYVIGSASVCRNMTETSKDARCIRSALDESVRERGEAGETIVGSSGRRH